MTKHQKIVMVDAYGWKTTAQYRKSMNDLTITQENMRDKRHHREVYIDQDEINNFIDFIKNLER